MIDLSKAYAGQILVLRNGTKHTLKQDVYVDSNGWCVIDDYGYMKDGTFSSIDRGGDIISIQDPIPVQVARLEGKIEAYDNIAGMIKHEFMRDFLIEKLEFRRQLKALQDENS